MTYILGKGISAHGVTSVLGVGILHISKLPKKQKIGSAVKKSSDHSHVVFTTIKSVQDVINKLESLKDEMILEKSLTKR